MRTLYVSDLDGTLLHPDERVSEYTVSVLNRLAARGVLFSYATARSFATASEIMKRCKITLPVIVHNGTFLADGTNGKTLLFHGFTKAESAEIYQTFRGAGLYPLVYSLIEERNRFSFLSDKGSRAQREFLKTRVGVFDVSRRAREISDEASALDGEVFYFTCIDEEQALNRIYDSLKEKYRCFYLRDIYSGEYWLEVLPKRAGKAAAAIKLKEMLGCDKLVCFGDDVNDIALFAAADECYAVGNAADALKEKATAVIGRNTEDSVAHWLEHNLLGDSSFHKKSESV